MKKKILILSVLVIFLTGCFGLSAENKKIKKEYEKEAKVTAKTYIKDKYGFDAKVVKAEAQTERNSLGPLFLTGIVHVTMNYNNKEFYVLVPVKNEYSKIGDTYQNDEIKKDYIKLIKSFFKKEPDYIDTNYDKESSNYYMTYFDKKYDKNSNIIDFLPALSTIYYINYKDFNKVDIEKLYSTLIDNPDNHQTTIYNLKDKDGYKYISKYGDHWNFEEYKLASIKFYSSIASFDKYNFDINDDIVFIGEKTTRNGDIIINELYNIKNYKVLKEKNEELANKNNYDDSLHKRHRECGAG